MKLLKIVVACSIAMTSAISAMAQTTQSIGYRIPIDVAYEAAKTAMQACEAKHYWVTATVVDMDGVVQLQLRGDKATVATGESSFRKAFTVVTLGPEFYFDRSSGFYELTKSNPFAPGLSTVHNVLALPGAVAFKVNGEIIGALGIGGAPGGDKDEVCAAPGVDKVANRLSR